MEKDPCQVGSGKSGLSLPKKFLVAAILLPALWGGIETLTAIFNDAAREPIVEYQQRVAPKEFVYLSEEGSNAIKYGLDNAIIAVKDVRKRKPTESEAADHILEYLRFVLKCIDNEPKNQITKEEYIKLRNGWVQVQCMVDRGKFRHNILTGFSGSFDQLWGRGENVMDGLIDELRPLFETETTSRLSPKIPSRDIAPG